MAENWIYLIIIAVLAVFCAAVFGLPRYNKQYNKFRARLKAARRTIGLTHNSLDEALAQLLNSAWRGIEEQSLHEQYRHWARGRLDCCAKGAAEEIDSNYYLLDHGHVAEMLASMPELSDDANIQLFAKLYDSKRKDYDAAIEAYDLIVDELNEYLTNPLAKLASSLVGNEEVKHYEETSPNRRDSRLRSLMTGKAQSQSNGSEYENDKGNNDEFEVDDFDDYEKQSTVAKYK